MEALFIPIQILAIIVTFIGPGLGVGVWLHRKKLLSPQYILLIACLVGGLIGYLTFWGYLLNPLAGEWLATILTLISWFVVVWIMLRHSTRKTVLSVDVYIPIFLLLAISIFYNGAALTCRTDQFARSCYTAEIALDNDLSSVFAENVRKGVPKDQIGDWKGSDRPPLQSGIILAQSIFTNDSSAGRANAQLLASVLQCFWVVAIWAICRSLRIRPAKIAFILALCIFSGFFFFNSILVWPKLLAAVFTLTALGLLIFEKPTRATWLIAALAGTAALLSHPGSLFIILPLFISIVVIFRKELQSQKKQLLVAVTCALLLLCPWLLYQKFYDPPGDRLTKWFLAGVVSIDKRDSTTAIVESYARSSFEQSVRARISNVRQLLGRVPSESTLVGTGKSASVRDAEFRYVLISLGIFNIGWLLLLSRQVRESLKKARLTRPLKIMGIIAGTSLLIWIMLLFTPRAAIIHQGAYGTMMLLFIILGILLSQLTARLRILLLGLQFVGFSIVWIITVLLHNPRSKTDFIASLIGFFFISFLLFKLNLLESKKFNAWNIKER